MSSKDIKQLMKLFKVKIFSSNFLNESLLQNRTEGFSKLNPEFH